MSLQEEHTKDRMLMEALGFDDNFESPTGEAMIQASYFADETPAATNGETRRSFGESALFDVEGEMIEASIYASFEASPKKDNEELERALNEVKMSFQPFEMTRFLKGKLVILLDCKGLRFGQFGDLNLDTMSTLNCLDKDEPVDQFFSEAYIGLFQCLWCLLAIRNDEVLKSGAVDIKMKIHLLAQQVENATSVLRYVMRRQGISIPNSSAAEREYTESTLGHLTELTDTYLALKWREISPSEYERLKRFTVLIKDFKVVSEIDFALRRLRTVLDEFAAERENKVERRSNNFMFSQMEETWDLSWACH